MGVGLTKDARDEPTQEYVQSSALWASPAPRTGEEAREQVHPVAPARANNAEKTLSDDLDSGQPERPSPREGSRRREH